MSVDENKEVVRRFIEAQNRGDVEGMLVCWAPNAVNHAGRVEGVPRPASVGPGLEGMRLVFESLHTAFPDRHLEITDLIGEGDRVVGRMTVSGTHQGIPAAPVEGGRRLQRITPSGRSYLIQQIHIFRIAEGKLVEHWATRDDLGLLEQLGGLPADE
jgi:predicted ester cyclase